MKVLRWLAVIAVIMVFGFALAEDKKVYKTDPAKCVGCQLCVSVCPVKAIAMKDGKSVIDPEKCVGCGTCASKCPVKAIAPSTYTKGDTKSSAKSEVKSETKSDAKPAEVKKKSEQQIKTVFHIRKVECTGCRECVPGCPVKAIMVVSGKAIIDPEKCIGCGRCQKACAFSAPEKKEIKQ